MQTNNKRRGLSFLLILAMLFVSVAVMLPVATSATGNEIDDFSYQTRNDFQLFRDKTSLRFVFTIEGIDYDEVGFVFSKTNSNPTVGGANCHTETVSKVYRSIMANGVPISAGEGRYWAAIKMNNIPSEYYNGDIYVRPYVFNGEYIYDTARSLSAWEANDVHVVEITTTNSGEDYVLRSNIVTEVLDGDHFYPTPEAPDGKDLYIEYSVLWNETLNRIKDSSYGRAVLHTSIRSSDDSNDNDLTWLSLKDGAKGSGCLFAGGFEYAALKTVEVGPANMAKDNKAFSDYPNIGGDDAGNPELGWHRIGIRYHQEVSNENEVKANTADATYHIFVETYVDGELISRLGNTTSTLLEKNYLFTAYNDGAGGIAYADIAGDVDICGMRMDGQQTSSGKAYFVYADYSVTCGTGFVMPVTKVQYPIPTEIELDGENYPSSVYFTTAHGGAHDWDGVFTNASPATTLLGNDGTKTEHCTICGQYHEEVSGGTLAYTPKTNVWSNKTNNIDYHGATLETVRGANHFYDAGNDLLVEYSILWNESIPNNINKGKPYLDTRFANSNKGNEPAKNIIYWSLADNVDGSDCAFAGGFEWGGVEVSKPDNPYPRFTGPDNNGGLDLGETIDQYPNIAGENLGNDVDQGDTQWGWHRVSIRYREEVVNKAALMADETPGATDPIYNIEMWVYIDGKLVIHSSVDDLQKWVDANKNKKVDAGEMHDRKLFTAESDGNGGINYTENDDVYLVGTYLNSVTAKSGKYVYMAIDEYSATIGSNFVQNVEKVPAGDRVARTQRIAFDTEVPTTMFYRLKTE